MISLCFFGSSSFCICGCASVRGCVFWNELVFPDLRVHVCAGLTPMLPTIFSLAEYGSAGERSRRANKRNIGRYTISKFTAKTRHYTHSCTPHNVQGDVLACSRAKQCLGLTE